MAVNWKKAREAEFLDLGAGAPGAGAFGHRVSDAGVQVADELVEDVFFAREVEVEGALGDACRLGDLHDRRVVVAELGEDMLRRLEQPPAGAGSAVREWTAVGAG